MDQPVEREEKDFKKELSEIRKEALPMYARRNDIIRTVQENQVSIVHGETGSGKSTQMTQYLHQAGFSQDGIIVCTQPRKVAVTSLATHVASEMATNVGNIVGYKVGMSSKLGGATKILYMTDRCLLNECLKDPSLSAYSCVIIDEAHERSIYTDLLLGMLKRCLKKRPHLKAIITSATIDPEVFVCYFGACSVLRVSGIIFPVEVIYAVDEDRGKKFHDYVEDAVNKAAIIHKEESPGDILVFVTTPLETEKCSDKLKNRLQERTDFKCLILHGQIQPEEQQMVFQPSPAGVRKIVFATNSAETSITIPGIKYVIDTGLVKEMRYDPRRNMSSLRVVVISRSSADQRKGSAGRTGPGKCYRLYTEQLYKYMDAMAQPEILKVHLGEAILTLTELGINPFQYDFFQRPGESAIATALETLEELGAVRDNIITEEGKVLSKLPIEPRLGLIVLKGRAEGAFFDSVVLAAVSSMGSSIFYRGGSDEDKKKADQLKMQFCHKGGDSLTWMNVYRKWIMQPEEEKVKWCCNNAVNYSKIWIVHDTVREITTVLEEETKLNLKHELQDPENVDEKLQKILFDSYVSNICHFLGHPNAGYYAARLDQKVYAHPSSVLNPLNMMPEWLVFEQSLKTSKDFITGLTPVNESWIVDAIKSGRLKRNLEEMRNKTLVPVFTKHVGSEIFWKIVGRGFSKLRVFEDLASNLVKPAFAFIEASPEKGELKVFSSDHSTVKLSDLFKPVIKTARGSLMAEDLEVSLSPISEKAGIRVVLELGGAVKDVLMPDEYRSVFVEKVDEGATKDVVMTKFGRFGKIKELRIFQNHQKQWGCITFEYADAAMSAVQNTRDDPKIVAVPDNEKSGRGYKKSEFKVTISWCRRKSAGFGSAEMESEEVSKLLHKGTFDICGRAVTVHQDSQNDQRLYLRNLGLDITEEDIKKTFMTFLQLEENDKNMTVKVEREYVKTSEKQLETIKQVLEANIMKFSKHERFSVKVKPPRDSNRLFFASASFTDAKEGIAACQGISKQISINKRIVTMEPNITPYVFISKMLYDSVKEVIDEYNRELSAIECSEVSIKHRTIDDGKEKLDIHASDALEMAKIKIKLQKILHGDVLECEKKPDLRLMFTTSGRNFLKETEKQFKACIEIDSRTRTITIQGTQEARSKVKSAVRDYLEDHGKGESMEVDLRGGKRSNGLMQTLMNEYGLELEKLQHETGLRSIMLNFEKQVVKITGPADKMNKATEIIDRVNANLKEGFKMILPEEEELPKCCVHFLPVTPKDLYRLEYCGHAYCLDCVKQQVEYAVKVRQLPLRCADCDQPFMLRDIENLSNQGLFTLTSVTSSSLSSFIMANKMFKYCLTPNCSMVYRVTKTGDIFQCPECSMKICTSCHTQYHEGLICAMYRSANEDEGNLDDYLSANSKTTKKCPGCGVLVEKNEGCNYMYCEACKCSFCWLCLASFCTSKACYDHLFEKHGGIF